MIFSGNTEWMIRSLDISNTKARRLIDAFLILRDYSACYFYFEYLLPQISVHLLTFSCTSSARNGSNTSFTASRAAFAPCVAAPPPQHPS
jgi:hypothetical protein